MIYIDWTAPSQQSRRGGGGGGGGAGAGAAGQNTTLISRKDLLKYKDIKVRKWSTKPLVFHTLKGFELQIPTWQSGRSTKRMLTTSLYLCINVYLSRGKNDNQW